jgi:uncharacterized membrane protein (DUF106 family)
MFLNFLFELPPFWAIFLITSVVTLATTLIYKFTTNQVRMRELRESSKKFQARMKAAREDPEKMMKIQNEAMKVNLELMKHSLRPTLYTFLPLLLIFWWLSGHLAYYNLAPGQEFNITAQFSQGISGNATISFIPEQGVTLLSDATQPVKDQVVAWRLKADAGTYKATFSFGGVTIEKQFLVAAERSYIAPKQSYKGAIEQVIVGNEPVRPFGDSFSLFGWYPGWLATYIVLSLALGIGLRKVLNVV